MGGPGSTGDQKAICTDSLLCELGRRVNRRRPYINLQRPNVPDNINFVLASFLSGVTFIRSCRPFLAERNRSTRYLELLEITYLELYHGMSVVVRKQIYSKVPGSRFGFMEETD